VPAEDLGQFGNGNYQLRFRTTVNSTYQEDIFEFEVDDDTEPNAPASLSVSAPDLDHPKVIWTHNSEIDLKHYVVYKKIDDGAWDPLGTTTNNYYWDTEETVMAFTNSTPATAYYRATAVDYINNASSYSNTDDIGIEIAGGTPDLKIAEIKPEEFNVAQNYPNPFNPETNITFGIPEANFVTLTVYNISGEKVATLVKDQLSAGSYTAKFEGSSLPSGVYVYRINAGSYSETKRMLLIK
jgi:type IX secretion system substrate protein